MKPRLINLFRTLIHTESFPEVVTDAAEVTDDGTVYLTLRPKDSTQLYLATLRLTDLKEL